MKVPQSFIVAVFLVAGALAPAQEDPAKHGKIAWHGTWKGGLDEAQRSGKPIMLVSAVPQCHSVPGVWWPGKTGMDRSFLADKDVISASRKFVCIRLATYENAEENEVLKGFYARGGNLENTVFTLLTPDGQTKLVAAGRSPAWAFGGVSGRGINAQPEESIKKMGQTMEAIALAYPGKGKATKGSSPLPYLADLRLALNVTAADRQPLVVVYSKSAEQRKKMEQELSKVAWSDQFIGEAQYVAASDASEFKAVKNFKATSGFVVVQPGTFGLTGEVIDVIDAKMPAGKLVEPLAKALDKHKPSTLTYNQHRQIGAQAGAHWKSATPNTDGLSRRGGGRRPRR